MAHQGLVCEAKSQTNCNCDSVVASSISSKSSRTAVDTSFSLSSFAHPKNAILPGFVGALRVRLCSKSLPWVSLSITAAPITRRVDTT
jgi:hypothetical protein